MHETPPSLEHVELDVTSHPYRSMGPVGLRYLLWFLLALNFVGACVFVSLGAWPVAGFMGLDVLGVWLALRISNAQARAFERIIITRGETTIERVDRRGHQKLWGFQTYWVKAIVQGEENEERVALSCRGRQVEVGVHLPTFERRAFGDLLQQALFRAKNSGTSA